MRFAYSGSCFKLRFRFRASHSGNGRAVEEPEIVYTGTVPWLDNFISLLFSSASEAGELEVGCDRCSKT